ncbi:hypothetical protein [Microcystis phage MaeS]|nr:hypothetical protein [Microcystis phage MaeS]
MTRKITNRMITDRWIAAFEKGKPFSPPEKRMMGIKLAQLKKSVKEHLESTGRQTSLSVEQIIIDCLEYSVMLNKPFRSIASLGYEVLEPSLDYWQKRRKLDEIAKEKQIEDAQTMIDQVNNSPVPTPQEPVKPKVNVPAWMKNDEW